MRSEALLVAAAFMLVAFSACLEEPAPKKGLGQGPLLAPNIDASEAFTRVREAMANVPCAASSVSSTATSVNLRGLVDDGLNEVGPSHSHAEFDLHEDLLLDSIYSNKGFTIVDISDPLEPKQLGYFVDPTASTPGRGSSSTLDVKFSHDGDNALVAYSDSIALVDITDRAAPKLVQTMPNPTTYRGQAHMLYDARIGDAEYVFVFPSISGEHVVVHKLTGSGADAKLAYLTTYMFASPNAPDQQFVAPHDGYVTYDPIANHSLLYLANSFYGVLVLNVDNPAQPERLASVLAQNYNNQPGNLAPSFYHSVQADWIDGKRIVVTSAEVGYNTLKVFDMTDFRTPRFLGEWVFDAQAPHNMQHNIQIVNGTLFEAHYAQGLFGFDLEAFVKSPGAGLKPAFHFQPKSGGSYWDVVVRKGLAYVSDTPQGLHVIGYGCFTAGDKDLTSDG